MNKSKENGKKESRMVTVEGLVVEIRPDSRSKRKYGVYLEDADDGERTWYDYWKGSSKEALPPGLVEDRRVRLEVKVSEGDKATFRDIQEVVPLDVDGDDGGPDQRSDDADGRHADRGAAVLPPLLEQLVDRLIGVYGADRGEVLVFIVRQWYAQNIAEIERMIEVAQEAFNGKKSD